MDIAKVLACLKDRGFEPYYFGGREEALNTILKLIPSGATVGFGGSQTAVDLNLPNFLNSNGYNVYHRSLMPDKTRDEVYLMSRDADWLITSTNAMSECGQLVNIDGRGNRVASMIYGPKNVLVILGINKITPDLESALYRAKNVAAPLNAKRFKLSTPCTVTGECMDCKSVERICRATVIMTNPTFDNNIHIIIINENLGF
jgi:L-lactate utilization protein LutB